MTIKELILQCEKGLCENFKRIDEIAHFNQKKVLDAFREEKVALRHFAPTSGYGYDDVGRDTLCKLFARVFNTEAAIVSPHLVSGTHAISVMLCGLLRPGDELISISGQPYDTLLTVINGKDNGSLRDFGIKFSCVDLMETGEINLEAVEKVAAKYPKVISLQRSRGYSLRPPLTLKSISNACKKVKAVSPKTIIVLDNCYGEFVDRVEPSECGCDLIAGSLIKNPGGGIAPTGGYIAGKQCFIDIIAQRLTCPGAGMEVGSYAGDYRSFYQGLFMAPHVTAQALKSALLFASVYDKLGYDVFPNPTSSLDGDIICSIKFGDRDKLIKFCQTIQTCSPIDSFAVPEPWDMPGYDDMVIMAAGSFVQGASIELSADSPIRPPYVAYLQGALTYEHAKIAVEESILALGLLK